MRELFRQFSFPGGIPSHVAPETPGSIHEGGELGYSLAHAYGAAFDNPDLIVACVVGDGEAETGPLATSWHANKFLNPVTDGAVLPILHLNGYKIANPTVLARIPRGRARRSSCAATATSRTSSSGDEPDADAPGDAPPRSTRRSSDIAAIQRSARASGATERPRWPMIVLRTPKGWTGPKDGRRPADRRNVARRTRFRSPTRATNPEHLAHARRVAAELPPGGAVRRRRAPRRRARARSRPRRAANGREPARQRRRCSCATSSCRTSATTPST